MNNQSCEWWWIIRDVLSAEWGYDPATLRPDTAIFEDSVAPWMDWVELMQAVMDRTGIAWPRGLNFSGLRTVEDLRQFLARYAGPHPHAG